MWLAFFAPPDSQPVDTKPKAYSMEQDDEKLFRNRQDAGEQLAYFLGNHYQSANTLVVGIPRGGVEVAYYVAQHLRVPLSLIVSKKLPYPGHKELGFGAIAEEHAVYVSQKGQESLPPEVIQSIIEKQADEVERRVKKYRKGKPLPDIKDKTVLLIDDGIATGVTLVPVVRLCRQREAGRIVVAAPVSGNHFDKHLALEADVVEVLLKPRHFYAVGQAYEWFGDFTDQELMDLLEKDADRLS